jgi:hypothetical protein
MGVQGEDVSCQVVAHAGCPGGAKDPSHGHEDGISEWRLAGGSLRGIAAGFHMIRSGAEGIVLT